MTTKKDNYFTLTCKDIVNIQYRPESVFITEGEPYDDPEISADSPGRWTITFKAGRKKSSIVAESFISIAGGSQYTMIVDDSVGDKTPATLNFFFGLNVTVRLPSGGLLDNLVIYLGQGFDGVANNWWLGTDNLINFKGKAVLLGTQSGLDKRPPQPGRIAWRATVEMSTSKCTLSALRPTAPTTIELLDVWGEGRQVTTEGIISGFDNSLNLNLEAQVITNGQRGQPIPQQVPVFNFDFPYFPIPDGSVAYVTLMGAPIIPVTAKEIIRVLNPEKGVVILWNLSANELAVWESNKGILVYKPVEKLEAPFDEINFENPRVYGFEGVVDNIEDHDEL